MPRYILIDSDSGYIFGDTADFAAGQEISRIKDAARLLDESIGERGRTYLEHDSPRNSVTGYNVYRADINGSEAVPVIHDGQDQKQIDAVEAACEYVGFVECIRTVS